MEFARKFVGKFVENYIDLFDSISAEERERMGLLKYTLFIIFVFPFLFLFWTVLSIFSLILAVIILVVGSPFMLIEQILKHSILTYRKVRYKMGFKYFFKPRWEHFDTDVRCRAVGRLKNKPLLLEQIARDRYQPDRVRAIAIERLGNQEIAAEIACYRTRKTSEYLGEKLVSCIIDEELLAKVAISNYKQKTYHDQSAYRIKALERIHSQNILVVVATYAQVPVARQAIKRIQDQNILVDIAIHAKDWGNANLAIEHVTDLQNLYKIAIEKRSAGGGIINRIDNQGMLEEIALKTQNYSIRHEAAKRIIDEDVLVRLAIEFPGDRGRFNKWEVRKIAIEKIKSQELLAKIVRDSTDCYYYTKSAGRDYRHLDKSLELAISKIDTPKLWNDIAQNAKNSGIRVLFLRTRDIDQNVIAQVAQKHFDRYVRDAAVKKLVDENVLAHIAKTDKDFPADTATKGICDNTLLYDIVKTSSRPGAVKRITDPEILEEIATKSDSSSCRFSAIKKITNKKLIEQIIETEAVEYIRKKAEERLIEIDDVSAIEPLLEAFKQNFEAKYPNFEKPLSTLYALERFGDKRAIKPLCQTLTWFHTIRSFTGGSPTQFQFATKEALIHILTMEIMNVEEEELRMIRCLEDVPPKYEYYDLRNLADHELKRRGL